MAGRFERREPVRSRGFAAAACLAMALAVRPAVAQEGPPLDADMPTIDTFEGASAWEKGETRLFFAFTGDVGFLYLRPRTSVGYGQPFHRWLGIDFNPTISPSAVGGYAGLRFSLPVADLRVGARYYHSLTRSFLPPRQIYDQDAADLRIDGQQADYVTLEAELTLSPELGPGVLFSETALTRIALLPEDTYVFEDTLRVVMDDSLTWRQRVGYLFPFFERGALSAGPVGELVGVTGRSLVVIRGGGVVRFRVSDWAEVRASFIPVLGSRDHLGISGGDVGLLSIRFRWATD